MASSIEAMRKLIYSNDSACRMVFRIAGGSESGIRAVLSAPAKMTAILRNVHRLSMIELERLVESMSTPGDTTQPPSWAEVENIKMANYAANTGNN